MTVIRQVTYSPSEAHIVEEGRVACMAAVPITDNPYPAVCPQSLREHWLWDCGWRAADICLMDAIAKRRGILA